MNRRFILTVISGMSLTLAATSTLACGESLYRIGKGVIFRSYTAPLPATILAVVNSPADQTMAEELMAAGHDVNVVTDPRELSAELDGRGYDIVLGDYSQQDMIVSSLEGRGTYVPVASSGTPEVSSARDRYAHYLKSDDSVKKFLQTIHRVVKKQRG